MRKTQCIILNKTFNYNSKKFTLAFSFYLHKCSIFLHSSFSNVTFHLLLVLFSS